MPCLLLSVCTSDEILTRMTISHADWSSGSGLILTVLAGTCDCSMRVVLKGHSLMCLLGGDVQSYCRLENSLM